MNFIGNNTPALNPIDVQDALGQTPLYLAAQGRNTKIVKLLLDNGADVSVLTDNRKSIVYGLLEKEFTDKCEKQECAKILRLLMNNGAPIEISDRLGMTLLHLAAKHKLKEVLSMLLPCFKSYDAVYMYNKTAAHILLDNIKCNENIHEDGEFVGIVKTMIDKTPTLPMMKDTDGRTLLHLAIQNKQHSILTMLLPYYMR